MMTKKNLSIYIHIPFCKSKCNYCDFLSGSNFLKYKDEYINSLISEINNFENEITIKDNNSSFKIPFSINDYIVSTIYIGGGTPSLLESCEIKKIVDAIYSKFEIVDNLEFSIEANPESVTYEKVRTWKNLGINRVSVGLQSANDNELLALGRVHDYKTFYKAYNIILNDVHNINIDIMYNIPCQSIDSFTNTLESVISLDSNHISAYSLIIENNTKFYQKYQNKEFDYDIDDEAKYEKILWDYTNKTRLNRYEISNYAKEGYMCRHNLCYFENNDYLSFGLGASSHIGFSRFFNERNIKKYIDNEGVKYLERKTDINLDMEDTIMMGFRMTKGIDKKLFKEKYNISINDKYKDIIEKYKNNNLIVEDDFRLYLTNRGLDISNIVIADFIK